MEKLEKFKALGLSDDTLKALAAKGFEEPTPIQQQTIPLLLNGENDIVGQAQTGTGKTAAFGLPIIERISEKANYIQALILAPTRELAIQVAEEINSLKGKKRITTLPVYGGQSIDQQLRRLKSGVDIVVGTPGRIIDHIHRGTLKIDRISYLVLDEADEMLNMGFIDDVEEIIKSTNEQKKVLLFSATMPKEILAIAKKYMGKYDLITIKKEQLTGSLTDQIYFEVADRDKFEALCRIVDIEHEFYGLVFCRTKIDVDTVTNKLIDRGYEAEGLHGDISQGQRERILNKFKNKRTNILVATDVAARGIDINNLSHVINYALPQDPESYVHRIGRTGRAGKQGTAITFVSPTEYRKLVFIERIAKTKIRKERVPKIDEIIKAKKIKIKDSINALITQEISTEYQSLASELLTNNDPQKVIASLLKHAFQDELDISSYNQIREISSAVTINKTGRTRLFVAKGSADNMTPRKLVDFIKDEAQIESQKIQDIRIFENFSFITAPFEEAEIILEIFKRKDTRPIVTKAKDKADSEHSSPNKRYSDASSGNRNRPRNDSSRSSRSSDSNRTRSDSSRTRNDSSRTRSSGSTRIQSDSKTRSDNNRSGSYPKYRK